MLAKLAEVLVADVDALADLHWADFTITDRLFALEQMETAVRTLRAVSATGMMSVADEGPEHAGGTPKQVIADRLRITPGEAKRRIDTAALMCQRTALTGAPLPPLLEHVAPHWRTGAVDDAHVGVITRFLHDLPADVAFDDRQNAERTLAGHATSMRPDELATVAHRLALSLNPDGSVSDADRKRKRGVVIGRQQADGLSPISGLLSPELRATLDAVFGKLAAPGMCNPEDDAPQVDGDPSDEAAHRDYRTTPQRTHDALLAAGRAVLASGQLGSHHGLPVTVIATTTLDQLESATGAAVTGSGTLLPMRDLIRLASHSYHYLAIYQRHSQVPLYLGRTRRLASAGQRIMLHATERGCSFPRCTVPAYLCEVMHIDDWKDGGPTDISHETLGCKPHHKLHTSGGWRVRKRADGRTEWIPPPQLPIPGAGGTNTYHHPEELLGENDDGDP